MFKNIIQEGQGNMERTYGIGRKTQSNRGGGVISHIYRSKYAKYFVALLVFLICFVLLLSFLDQFYFDSDEGDIYSGGVCVSHGQLIYKETASQHMPLMYYIAGLFSMLGASTIYEFRLAFSLFFSLLCALNVIWYWNRIHPVCFILSPLLYIVSIKNVSMGTNILSEHALSAGITILFCELMCFCDDDSLNLASCMRISFAIFLSFGSLFISAFPIFFVALTVLALEIKRFVCSKREEKRIWWKTFLRKYLRLAIVVAVPFCVLILYYILTDSLRDFYYWAYKFNREIYANYSGMGGSVGHSMFAGLSNILTSLKGLSSGDPNSIYLAVLTGAGLLSMVIIGIYRKSLILPVGLLLTLNGCESRATIDSFHSVQAIMLLSVIICYTVSLGISIISITGVRIGAEAACVIALLVPLRDTLTNLGSLPALSTGYQPGSIQYYVDLLTEEGERIGNSTLMQSIYIQSKTVPASVTSASVKWMWEGGGEQAMQELRENPPRVYVLDKGYATWGFPLTEYAQDLVKFIDKHYTPLSAYYQDNIYVLNSYYKKACKIMDAEYDTSLFNADKQIRMCVDDKTAIGKRLRITGWAFVEGERSGNQETYVLVKHKGRLIGVSKAKKSNRPDVADVYGKKYQWSGFYTVFNVGEDFDAEDIDLVVLIVRHNRIYSSEPLEGVSPVALPAAA